MKVFLSWAGSHSGQIAELLRDWLPMVLPKVSVLFSEDLHKGDPWMASLQSQLAVADVGIFCLTPNNIRDCWLHFEAGALSSRLGAAKICPVLFHIDKDELISPWTHYQHCRFSRRDMQRLIEQIGAEDGLTSTNTELVSRFSRAWPALEADIDKIGLGDLPLATGRTCYLRGTDQIYRHALLLLQRARSTVRVVQHAPGPRPPEWYAEAASQILREKKEAGIAVSFDVLLVADRSKISGHFDEKMKERWDVYRRQGVDDCISLHVAMSDEPANLGFDILVVDGRHAHIGIAPTERFDTLQSGVSFEDNPMLAGDLDRWINSILGQLNAERYHPD